jgi:hypothetical protein
MAELSVTGQAELVKLLAKKDTWTPPVRLAEFLGLILKTIAVNQYKNLYEELDPRDLYALTRIKLNRAMAGGKLDMNELVKAGAAAGLLYVRVTPNRRSDSGPVLKKDGSLVNVGDKHADVKQVNGLGKRYEAPPPPPAKPPEPTENTSFLKGWKCPSCGSLGPFEFKCACDVVVTDSGVIAARNVKVNTFSSCKCQKCSTVRRVCNFSKKGKK